MPRKGITPLSLNTAVEAVRYCRLTALILFDAVRNIVLTPQAIYICCGVSILYLGVRHVTNDRFTRDEHL